MLNMEQQIAALVDRYVEVELKDGRVLVGRLTVALATNAPYSVMTLQKGTSGAADRHYEGIRPEQVVRIIEIAEDDERIRDPLAPKFPEHESEGQALTEASQTDE